MNDDDFSDPLLPTSNESDEDDDSGESDEDDNGAPPLPTSNQVDAVSANYWNTQDQEAREKSFQQLRDWTQQGSKCAQQALKRIFQPANPPDPVYNPDKATTTASAAKAQARKTEYPIEGFRVLRFFWKKFKGFFLRFRVLYLFILFTPNQVVKKKSTSTR